MTIPISLQTSQRHKPDDRRRFLGTALDDNRSDIGSGRVNRLLNGRLQSRRRRPAAVPLASSRTLTLPVSLRSTNSTSLPCKRRYGRAFLESLKDSSAEIEGMKTVEQKQAGHQVISPQLVDHLCSAIPTSVDNLQ